jgi:hypothetical protein
VQRDDHDRVLRVAEHVVAHGAEKPTEPAASSVATQNQEIGVEVGEDLPSFAVQNQGTQSDFTVLEQLPGPHELAVGQAACGRIVVRFAKPGFHHGR